MVVPGEVMGSAGVGQAHAQEALVSSSKHWSQGDRKTKVLTHPQSDSLVAANPAYELPQGELQISQYYGPAYPSVPKLTIISAAKSGKRTSR
jgi:hypothetical protein